MSRHLFFSKQFSTHSLNNQSITKPNLVLEHLILLSYAKKKMGFEAAVLTLY